MQDIEQIETDLVAYIMGLWDQEHRFKMIKTRKQMKG